MLFQRIFAVLCVAVGTPRRRLLTSFASQMGGTDTCSGPGSGGGADEKCSYGTGPRGTAGLALEEGPLSAHVFCDESKAGGFRLAAVTVKLCDLAELRSTVAALRLPGQRRLHFANESDGRRKKIIKTLSAAEIRAVVYDAPTYRTEKDARDAIIGQLTDDVAAMGATRLVLERDDSAVASDRQIIIERLAKAGNPESLRYEHRRAHEECLLSVPDAIIWAWAKGGRWRKSVGPLVTDVVVVS